MFLLLAVLGIRVVCPFLLLFRDGLQSLLHLYCLLRHAMSFQNPREKNRDAIRLDLPFSPISHFVRLPPVFG
jgi:hypothetical protein